MEWVTEETNPTAWEALTVAFAAEETDSSFGWPPLGMDRAALHERTALVFLKFGLDEEWFPPFFRIYSYHLDSGEKRLLPQVLGVREREEFWLNLELEGTAYFESSAPDVVFQHQDCWECEPTRLLSSMMYAEGEWSPRTWEADFGPSESVMIHSSHQYGEYLWRYQCARRIWDHDSDGADERAMLRGIVPVAEGL